jgi:5-methyltetrahydropteroyltriglutamate--homocysteine methyltransferase
MSLNKSSLGFEKLTLKLAELISSEIAGMAAAGAAFIQVEEPWLARNPEYFDLFKEAFGRLSSAKGAGKLILALYFGDIGAIIKRLENMPADMIGIDFTYSPGLLERLAVDGFPIPLSFGILDGRNTRLEAAAEIARSLEPALAKAAGGECHITTSCGLEYLPRMYAIKKLELTAEVAGLING